ncbi:MAG: hypothetical protein ACYDA3_08340 [Gaiellaceae bacterium]
MQHVGEHEVPVGPLAVRWRAWQLLRPARAGTVTEVDLVFENAGRVGWTHGASKKIEVSYHWLDDRGNAIVWGEIWTPLSRTVAPGETIEQRIELRAPLRAGPHRLAFDLVEEGRYWFSEVGNTRLEVDVDVQPRIERRLAVTFAPGPSELVAQSHKALEAQDEALVEPGEEAALGHLAPGCLPAPDWSRRVLDAHQAGFAVVAGSIEVGGLRKPKTLQPWAPGRGRVPNFQHRLLGPSLIPGSEPSWDWKWIEGLPALARPPHEPWLYDGRIVIRARPRSGRRSA